jgi:Arabinose efflux permease
MQGDGKMDKPSLWTKDFLIDTIVNLLIYLIYYLLMVIMTVFATDNLHASLSEAGLASGIFILGTLFARLFAGRSIEQVGRKKMLYIGLSIYFITTLFYFVVNNLPFLYTLRFLHGAGFGVASTATSTIISNIIPSARRGEGVNYYALSTSIAAAIGPFFGMFLNQHVGFNLIFVFCTILLAVCLIASFFLKVLEIELTKEEIDKMKEFKVTSFIEFNVLPIAIVSLLIGFCYSSVLSFLAAYTKEINLVDAGTFFFVVYASVVSISRPFTGLLFDKQGENFVMYPCYIFLAIGLIILSQTHHGYILLLAGVFVGLGYGTFMSNAQAISIKVSPRHRMGLATSTYFIFLDAGLGIGPFLLGFLRPTVGFRGIYIVTAVIAFLCLFLYYALHGKKAGKGKNIIACS